MSAHGSRVVRGRLLVCLPHESKVAATQTSVYIDNTPPYDATIGTTTVARQRKLQIMGYFTTQSLYNHSFELSSKDYKLENLHLLACLHSSLFAVLLCLKLTVRRHIEFYAGGLICQYLWRARAPVHQIHRNFIGMFKDLLNRRSCTTRCLGIVAVFHTLPSTKTVEKRGERSLFAVHPMEKNADLSR
jgi:hypothetical protein